MLKNKMEGRIIRKPASLGHIPAEHWWQASGSVPAQLGCLIQAGLNECTVAGRCSAAPRAGQRQTDHRRLSATSNRQIFHVPSMSPPKKHAQKSSFVIEVKTAKP